MMQSTQTPGIIALTPALSKALMLLLTMLTPAWPKPSASNVPSLMIVFSRTAVSARASSFLDSVKDVTQPAKRLNASANFCRVSMSSGEITVRLDSTFRLSLCFLASSTSNWASAILIAWSGFSRMVFTLRIIRSIGAKTKLFASAEKSTDATVSTIQTKTVVKMPNFAPARTKGRMSKKKAMCHFSNCVFCNSSGLWRRSSAGRKSVGHLIGRLKTPGISRDKRENPKCAMPPNSQTSAQGDDSASRACGGKVPTL
mmetsp:Transcript_24154/g.69506  ORF Transcript_24154/g.69506 Transcript_24154/m.69506 type:complete len:257 (-) Transcript_24154:277-1047(-)